MPGAMIVERRPKARRACLGCGRLFVTTIARRLCPACTGAVAQLQVGAIASASVVLPRAGRGR